MRRILFWCVSCLFLALSFYRFAAMPSRAAEECGCPSGQDELECNKSKQACYNEKIGQKKAQAQTLSGIISELNGKITVQQLQIRQTQLEIDKLVKEVEQLSQRISGLNNSLDRLTSVLISRVDATYKHQRANPLNVLLISDSVQSFFTKYKYLQVVQKHTSEVMQQAETQKMDFDQQKSLKEAKQKEVDEKRVVLQQQQNQLTGQRADQQTLLDQTRNDEARYQSELAKTLAELGAIQSILAGNGREQKVREVAQGDTIASIISGSSACSNGTHLHFEVVKDSLHQNPASYLKAISAVWNNQPDEPFGFGGDWDWPLNDPAKINQGFGMTWYARVRRSYGGAPHTGIDMMSKNNDMNVKAVKPGELYRGSIGCGGGQLRYVRVQHKDSDLSTYYLHINY